MRGAVVLILGLVFCSTSPVLVSGNVMGVEDDSSLSHLDGAGAVSLLQILELILITPV